MLEKLTQALQGKVVIVGVGNLLRSDDAFGCLLAKRLKNRITLAVEEVANAPENFLGRIIREQPDTILFVDALDSGAQPGQLRLRDLEKIETGNLFFTHNPSPQMLVGFLKENTFARMYLLAVQPKDISLGEKLSPEVERALAELSAWFLEKYKIYGRADD